MRKSKHSLWVLGSAGVCAAVMALSPAMSRRAHAFGGVWSSSAAGVRQAAQEVIFVDHPDRTVTAIVRIEHAGEPQDFAWLIPVPGRPTVEVSSRIVFERLREATAPRYWVEVGTQGTCAERGAGSDASVDGGGASSSPAATPAPTFVVEGTAGPYEYLDLAVDPTADDPVGAARAWLARHGYAATGLEDEALAPYLREGMSLLALRLRAGADVGAIRPVALTYESEQPIIPLRAAAVAVRDDMDLRVWVIGPAQAVPANYGSLVLNDAVIDWLSGRTFLAGTLPAGGTGTSAGSFEPPRNYGAVVTAAADQAQGRGFVTELAGPASQFRQWVWSAADEDTLAFVSSRSEADGVDAVLAARAHYGSWDGFAEALEDATTLAEGISIDDFGRDPERYRGLVQVDTARFLELLEQRVTRPVADAAAWFRSGPYLTRLYTTMSAGEMTVDPTFDYNADLAQVSNVHVARQLVDCDSADDGDELPWRVHLPQGGVVVGRGERWPFDEQSMPAALKVVMLSSSGSGSVVEDNSERIGRLLFEASGLTGDLATPQAPRDGLLIGGSQTLLRYREPHVTRARARGSKHASCSLGHAGAPRSEGSGGPLAFGSLLLMATLARRGMRMRRRRRAPASCMWAWLFLAACGDGGMAATAGEAGAPGALTREQRRDPESCKGCHPKHYREWSASMHAYAAQDPVFLAMNRRGQRETDGALGDFCVRCHAPMAVFDGSTSDGLNLEELPDFERGVSCYFCHNVVDIEDDHNGKLRLADDGVMRGPIRDPATPAAHGAEFSPIFDGNSPESSAMCGGCHDIVTPNGVHLERTFEEYLSGVFAKSATGEPEPFETCVSCHMPAERGFAAVSGAAGPRMVTEHLWPGVDVAVTDFPHREAMHSAVEDCQLASSVIFFTLEVTPPDLFTFQIETSAGHNTPSGASQDRRMWLEFLAYDEDGELLEEASSGDIAPDEVADKPPDHPEHDPRLAIFRDRIYDAEGNPVHMFWEAEPSSAHPYGYESTALPVATTTYVEGEHSVIKQYRASGPNGLPARVTARLKMRPIGLDVLQDLVDSGDLEPAIMAEMPTFTFSAQIEWTREDGLMQTISAASQPDCGTYRCLLDPSSERCD